MFGAYRPAMSTDNERHLPPRAVLTRIAEDQRRSTAFWKAYHESPESSHRWALSVSAFWRNQPATIRPTANDGTESTAP